jgi:hypothetical protein
LMLGMQGRGFSTWSRLWSPMRSATVHEASHKTPGAGPKKDSYQEVKHLPDRPEPVISNPTECTPFALCTHPGWYASGRESSRSISCAVVTAPEGVE